jgi:hypothetical protein
VCFSLALVTQHSKRTLRIVLPSVACLAVPYAYTLSHIGHDFRKKFTEHEMCVLIFSRILSEKFLILRIRQDVIIFTHRSSCGAPVMTQGSPPAIKWFV